MTKLNHGRPILRLIDEAKKRRGRSAPDEPSPTNDVQGFLDDQDRMGSALSMLSYQRPDFVIQLTRNFDHAFAHNDLSVLNKHIGASLTQNERSILMRIIAGLFHSHEFSKRDGRFVLERRGKLKWRTIGVLALHSNLAGYRAPNGERHSFSENFKKKLAASSWY